jgi:hydroxymethylbilane synthase
VDTIRLGLLPDALGQGVADQVAPLLEQATGQPVSRVVAAESGFTATKHRVGPLRRALRENRCDVAVHRLTNVPNPPISDYRPADDTSEDAPELVYLTPARTDPRDALCAPGGQTLDSLPRGARVGTDQPRRAAQLLSMRPDLDIVATRGDAIEQLSRVRPLAKSKVAATTTDTGATPLVPPPAAGSDQDLDAVVLSYAVLDWLGRTNAISQVLEPVVVAPEPGQGALAVEIRAADAELREALRAIEDRPTRLAVIAEREAIARLEALHQHPMGTWGRVDGDELLLGVAVPDLSGTHVIRHRAVAKLPRDWQNPESDQQELDDIAIALGARVANRLTISAGPHGG